VPTEAPDTGAVAAERGAAPGALTATAGIAALVYGLSNAATTPDGVSHWGDTKVVAALTAAAVLLTAFAVIETRSRYALLPMRLLRSRDRSGAFLISLCIGTAILGMFFFLTVFIQEVWGYSALRTGVAYLPYVPVILVMTVVAQRGVSRIGARPLLIAGSALAAGGMFWLSRITEHSTYGQGRRARVPRPGRRAADPGLPPRAGDRVLPGLPGRGRHPGPGGDHRAGRHPGHAPGPVRHRPDVRTGR